LWREIRHHQEFMAQSGLLQRTRRQRLESELRRILISRLEQEIEHLSKDLTYADLVQAVVEHRIDPYSAADHVVMHLGHREHADDPTGTTRRGDGEIPGAAGF
jgi:putative protein kinase ArgK-like GTPase of G3E family